MFTAKHRWRLVGPVHVTRGESGFGFTLRGDSPVLIAAVVPGGHAAVRTPVPPPGAEPVGGTVARGWVGSAGGSRASRVRAGGRPAGGRLHRVGERPALPLVEACRGGGPADGCRRRGREPAGGDAAAQHRAARHGEPPGRWGVVPSSRSWPSRPQASPDAARASERGGRPSVALPRVAGAGVTCAAASTPHITPNTPPPSSPSHSPGWLRVSQARVLTAPPVCPGCRGIAGQPCGDF